MVICIASLWIYAPEFFVTYNGTYEIFNPRHNRKFTRRIFKMAPS
jgi:hypothetical protein